MSHHENWFQDNKSCINYDDGDMTAVGIVMIMMLRIMVTMILIIAKVMVMKSMIIKMITMFTMMITVWLNTECSNYSTYIRGGFLDFCHFVIFFEIYSLTVHEIYFERNILAAILRQGFCLSEKDCYKYWWMVVAFEWTLSSFLKLFTICSVWSLLNILMVNHNGVFFV